MTHTFADVTDLSRLQQLLDSQYAVTGIPVVILDPGGTVILGTPRPEICETFFRMHPESGEHCRKCEAAFCRRLAGGESSVAVKCENGIGRITAPILIDGKIVAVMYQCGFFLPDTDPEKVLRCSKRYRFDPEAFPRAIRAVPVFKVERLTAQIEYLRNLAGMVSDLAQRQAHGIILDRELDRIETALYASESRFRNYFNLPLVGIFIARPDSRLVDANDKCCSMLGYSRREMSDSTWDMITHPDDRAANHRNLARVITGEIEGFTIDTRCIRRNGIIFHAILNVRGIRKSGGEVDYFLAVLLDITRRKLAEAEIRTLNNDLERRVAERTMELESAYSELKKSAEEISDLYNNAPCGYHSLDKDGVFVRINDTELRWIGYTRQEVIGKLRAQDIVAPESVPAFLKTYSDFKERGFVHDQHLVFRRKDGTDFPILVNATAIRDAAGQYLMSRSTLFDMTELKEAETALRSSEEKYRILFSNDIYSVSILEMETARFLDVNDAFARMYGYTRAELLGGMTFGDIVGDAGGARDLFVDSPEQAGFAIPLQHHRKRTDEEFPVEVFGRRYEWMGERAMFMVTRDITARMSADEALRRSERQFRAIFNSVFQFLILLEPSGIMIDQNRTARDFAGMKGEQDIGRPFWECAWWLSPKARRSVRKAVSAAARGNAVRYETTVTGKKGREATIDFSLKPVRDDDGKVVLLVAEGHEITERKQMENELRRRSEELSLANIDLAKAARLKDDFLASMSHELRTPLNAILGMSEALQEVVFGPLNERQRKSVQSIEESGRHLLSLINDILDLSKIEAGKMELQLDTFSVEGLCQMSLRFIRELASKKRLRVSEYVDSTLTTMLGDERRLKQMLINLLSNAVKFTPEEGEIGLEAAIVPDSEVVRFTVWDTGIGIAPEDSMRLFQPFVQLDSSLSRQYPGTGLGLSLVKRIAELHGGTLELESTPGKGSRFSILIPYARECEIVDPDSIGLILPPPITFRKALIVDDTPESADRLARYLTDVGVYSVFNFQGDGAIEQAKVVRPDIIFLGILLRDVPGWDILRALKEDPLVCDIPVVIVSVVDDRQHGLSLGAEEYLVKPVNREQVYAALGRISARTSAPRLLSKGAGEDETSVPERPLILLAEDERSNIETLFDYLQARGYRIALARNGQEAIDAARREHPAIILMDIQMPVLDGIEATRRIHSDPELLSIPIVALTALAMTGDRERCLEAGACDYITKPASLKHLVHTIEKHLHPCPEETHP